MRRTKLIALIVLAALLLTACLKKEPSPTAESYKPSETEVKQGATFPDASAFVARIKTDENHIPLEADYGGGYYSPEDNALHILLTSKDREAYYRSLANNNPKVVIEIVPYSQRELLFLGKLLKEHDARIASYGVNPQKNRLELLYYDSKEAFLQKLDRSALRETELVKKMIQKKVDESRLIELLPIDVKENFKGTKF